MENRFNSEVYRILEENYSLYSRVEFIENDPIQIPHMFSKKEDIEISGLFAAIFSWGLRKTILNKSKELLELMDNAPHDFILNHSEKDLIRFEKFKHRTFNYTDLLYFISFLKEVYQKNSSLEEVFFKDENNTVEEALIYFRKIFVSGDYLPSRTGKHISSPSKNSSCKRLNMYLRWMVRKDDKGIDFGLWTKINPSKLICPIDIHVLNIGRQLGLIDTIKSDWRTAVEITERLRTYDADDPVKYDFALFGLGVSNRGLG